ncbi:MAG: serine/threonine-protein phosphatase [Planctomycetes bacterium]|nr:serine/threonine-protein phosphatase [Planctomycetota bacterium]
MLSRTGARERELALRIHRSLLPAPFEDDRAEFAYSYDPIEPVGGDCCRVEYVGRGRLAVQVSDVTGHGVASALMVGRVSSFIQGSPRGRTRPREVVGSLNEFLCARFAETGMLMTFFAVLLDPARRRLTWAGAGHPPAFLVPPRGPAARLDSQNPILGAARWPVSEGAHELPPGSLLFLFTDGLVESRNGSAFGLDRLATKLESLRGARAADAVREIGREAGRLRGRPVDDVLLLAVRVK